MFFSLWFTKCTDSTNKIKRVNREALDVQFCYINLDMQESNYSLPSCIPKMQPVRQQQAAILMRLIVLNIFAQWATQKHFSDAWWCKAALVCSWTFRLATQSGDVVFEQYFQLPDCITPTHLTLWSRDKYLCSTAVQYIQRTNMVSVRKYLLSWYI